ncbi:tRNA (5-methylaminomethyl-2-thiouridine)(34)-methyltransferase MnmD [Lentibacter algarum]|uniref:tRNA (5-methylaminomethyl-2-thiouridine)(34)-methyltransferase MnmD n=1 Tax=Lentibacter algarum TaxID=576131 RepID=UPI001C079BE1|nr:tRNA (5-methylaminomethyl-2-thiouridine)(34)-methyltransferase MnmD [Lentibacter algarum]MBU2980533.1 tRNA (5-methylaminomethyl-2-thiouridine)(34)-methyltransferase MnmD [Lentibacter algarum]
MNQTAELSWRSGQVPVSERFDDPYFSLENGLAETTYVFLDGNDLPARFRDGFHIAELGFGTGLNLLATLKLWRDSGQQGCLHFTSFEAFPMDAEAMLKAQAAFPELADIREELAPHWLSGATAIKTESLSFNLILGDARKTVSNMAQKSDAWFLDGFSPAKNPELWEQSLLAQVAAQTAPKGTAATYTAAGFVRRSLEAGGFTVQRRQGYGRKRHMTVARMPA